MSTTAHDLRDVLATSSTSTSFTALAPKTTEPSGAGVFKLESIGLYRDDYLVLLPWGTNADNETFFMRIWEWTKDVTDPANIQYIPKIILGVSVTLGNIVAGKGANSFFADTITPVLGDTGTARIINPGNDLTASMVLDLMGAQYIEYDWDLVAAAAANASYRFADGG